jgi:hypothetical protein
MVFPPNGVSYERQFAPRKTVPERVLNGYSGLFCACFDGEVPTRPQWRLRHAQWIRDRTKGF